MFWITLFASVMALGESLKYCPSVYLSNDCSGRPVSTICTEVPSLSCNDFKATGGMAAGLKAAGCTGTFGWGKCVSCGGGSWKLGGDCGGGAVEIPNEAGKLCARSYLNGGCNGNPLSNFCVNMNGMSCSFLATNNYQQALQRAGCQNTGVNKCMTCTLGGASTSMYIQCDGDGNLAHAEGGTVTAAPFKKKLLCTSTGDPHYIGFDGKRFDFYGIGEYWLVKHSMLKIQTRLKRWNRASANTAMAVSGSVVGDRKVDIRPDGKGSMTVSIDGQVQGSSSTAGTASISRTSQLVTVTSGDYSIKAYRWGNEYISIHVIVPEEDGSSSSWGGHCGLGLSRRRASQHDSETDRVSKTDSSFVYDDGESYDSVNTKPNDYSPGDSCTDQELKKKAEETCAAADDMSAECVKDVCATGDIAAAQFVIEGNTQRKEELAAIQDSSSASVVFAAGVWAFIMAFLL